jgi:shikimate kinase
MIPKFGADNIVLIGMPGCGKTTIGKLLANMLDYKFVDSDQLIIDQIGKTPRQIVEEKGRDFFLKIQDEVVLEFKQNNCVFATGGGIVHSELAMKHLTSIGIIVYLNTQYHVIEERMDLTRKLVKKDGTLLDLYNERVPLYNKYADVILNCDSIDPKLLCDRILKLLI